MNTCAMSWCTTNNQQVVVVLTSPLPSPKAVLISTHPEAGHFSPQFMDLPHGIICFSFPGNPVSHCASYYAVVKQQH